MNVAVVTPLSCLSLSRLYLLDNLRAEAKEMSVWGVPARSCSKMDVAHKSRCRPRHIRGACQTHFGRRVSARPAAMLHQPRVPPTGQRQAIEIQIKWREVLAQKQAMLDILALTTGHSVEKLDKARRGAQRS